MDKRFISFDEATHTYTNTKTGYVFEHTVSRLAHTLSGMDYSHVNKELLEQKAKFGTAEHLIIEKYNNEGVFNSESENLAWFVENLEKEHDKWISEELIYTEGLPLDYAGTIDLLAFDNDKLVAIGDIKTGVVNKKYVRFQLSFYRLAYCRMYGLNMDDIQLFCWDAKGKSSKYVPIDGYTEQELTEMLQCVRDGIPYAGRQVVELEDYIDAVDILQNSMLSIKAELEVKQKSFEEMKAKIYELMVANKVECFETALLKFTPVAPTTTTSLDLDKIAGDSKLKAMYDKLPTKQSDRKGYLRVTEKKI